MEKRKVFVIFTYEIFSIGGTQMLTAGQASYMKKQGWEVFVCFAGQYPGTPAIPSLTEYVPVGGGGTFLFHRHTNFNAGNRKKF